MLKTLTQYDVELVVQVYSHLPNIHDTITHCPGSFHNLQINLKRLQDAGVGLNFTLLITDLLKAPSDTLTYYRSFGPVRLFTDYLYPSPEGRMERVPMTQAEKLVIKRVNLRHITIHEFLHAQEFHPCLYGKLAISADGFLLPCPAMPENVVGDLREESLQALFEKRVLDPYWQLTKDHIKPCQDCEFRYACPDCRALHARVTGHLTKVAYCSYNPITGMWHDDYAALVMKGVELRNESTDSDG